MKINTTEKGEVEIVNLPYIFLHYAFVDKHGSDCYLIQFGETKEGIEKMINYVEGKHNSKIKTITRQIGFENVFDFIEYMVTIGKRHPDEIKVVRDMKEKMSQIDLYNFDKLMDLYMK